MNCPRTEDLSALVDSTLGETAQTALSQHLQACPICRRQLAALQALREALHALPSPALGFDLAAQWQQQLPRHRPRPRRPGSSLSGWMPTGLAAGAALVSGLWLGGLLLGAGAAVTARGPAMVRVFDPVPPGGLCAATELCRMPDGPPNPLPNRLP
ncbi:MAG: zf-HC2 domain-containing protein [Burkholderiales bacterium]|nr:zf-HC2 domain-containing protein [Burkholderiales bacterium]